MPMPNRLPEAPAQLLPREAYISDAWLERERRDLFSNAWTFVGITTDFKESGDYRTVRAGRPNLDFASPAQSSRTSSRSAETKRIAGCRRSLWRWFEKVRKPKRKHAITLLDRR